MSSKADLRRRHLADRLALLPETRARLGARIAHAIELDVRSKGYRQVLLFLAHRGEPDLSSLARLAPRVTLGLPVVAESGMMTFHAWSPGTPLVKNRYGIEEPEKITAALVTPDAQTLVLVPALAVDKRGCRLGYGGGFYDRFLAAGGKPCTAVGVVYGSQLVDALPSEGHDALLTGVFTEDGFKPLP